MELLGLQIERTALAWRRTAMSVLLAALVGVRVIALKEPQWAALLVSGGLAAAAVVAYTAFRRLDTGARTPAGSMKDVWSFLPGGGALALVAGGQIVAGLAALAFVVV